MNQYINVSCDEYSLLVDVRWVEEVIDSAKDNIVDNTVAWRGQPLTYIDLTDILMGHAVKQNRHCLILTYTKEGRIQYLAVGVGEVSNIEVIKEEHFEELPNLDFPFNDYFDKAYVEKGSNKCIYRLRNLAKQV